MREDGGWGTVRRPGAVALRQSLRRRSGWSAVDEIDYEGDGVMDAGSIFADARRAAERPRMLVLGGGKTSCKLDWNRSSAAKAAPPTPLHSRHALYSVDSKASHRRPWWGTSSPSSPTANQNMFIALVCMTDPPFELSSPLLQPLTVED